MFPSIFWRHLAERESSGLFPPAVNIFENHLQNDLNGNQTSAIENEKNDEDGEKSQRICVWGNFIERVGRAAASFAVGPLLRGTILYSEMLAYPEFWSRESA